MKQYSPIEGHAWIKPFTSMSNKVYYSFQNNQILEKYNQK